MRRICLAGLLLATASCTTVQPQASHVAGRGRLDSHFRVAGDQPSAIAAVSPHDPADDEGGRVTLASVSAEPKAEQIAPAAFQEQAPPAPAPINDSNSATDGTALDDVAPATAMPAGGLTLEQALAMALGDNPTLSQAAASVGRLQAEWAQSGYCPNPTLGYAASEIGNEGRAGQQGIYFGQIFVTADKLDHNRAVASGGVSFAQAQVEAQRLRVTTDTTIRFYEALGAQRLVEIAERTERNASLGLDATRSRFDIGEVSRADVLQAEVGFQRAGVSVRQAHARAEGAWRRLAAMLGHAELQRTTLIGSLESDRIADEFEAVWQRLRATSPELQAASARVVRTRARIGREQAQAVPDVDMQNVLQYDTSTNFTVVGLQWTVPLPIVHKNQGIIAAAQAEHVRACRDYQRIELDLRDRLAAASRDMAVAREQVETYRDEVLPAADESLGLVREGYEQGEFDVLRLITSQQTYADASAEYVQALIDLRTAQARIDGLLLTGGLDEPTAPNPVGGFGGLADVPRAE